MNVVPMVTVKNNLINNSYACALTYTDTHTDTSDNIICHIPFISKQLLTL